MLAQVPGWGYKNNQKSVAVWVKYTQNATLVFISAYSIYVFCGKRTIPLSTHLYQQRYLFWLREKDSNHRPSGYEGRFSTKSCGFIAFAYYILYFDTKLIGVKMRRWRQFWRQHWRRKFGVFYLRKVPVI